MGAPVKLIMTAIKKKKGRFWGDFSYPLRGWASMVQLVVGESPLTVSFLVGKHLALFAGKDSLSRCPVRGLQSLVQRQTYVDPPFLPFCDSLVTIGVISSIDDLAVLLFPNGYDFKESAARVGRFAAESIRS